MSVFIRYFGQARGAGGSVFGLPAWAKYPLAIAAIPGLVLALLSILCLAVSLLALLLVTAPVYALLRAVTASRKPPDDVSGGVRRVEATVIE